MIDRTKSYKSPRWHRCTSGCTPDGARKSGERRSASPLQARMIQGGGPGQRLSRQNRECILAKKITYAKTGQFWTDPPDSLRKTNKPDSATFRASGHYFGAFTV